MILEKLPSKTKKKGFRAKCRCDYCGKEFIQKYSHAVIRQYHFCCKQCRNVGMGIYQTGENNGCWKNGTGIYRKIYEESHNTKLKAGEVIHHIDGDRTNNKIENLEKMFSGEHRALHNKLRTIGA